MNSRRGTAFFWIVQALLVPAWVCFLATVALKYGVPAPIFLKIGLATGLLQAPCTALAMVLALAAALGKLLPGARLRLLYLESAAALLTVTLVFLWRGVYRV